MVFFEVPQTGSGILFIGPRPQTDALDQWIAKAKDLGIERVICFMTETELTEKGLGQEPILLAEQNIAFTHFPIADFGIPDTPSLEADYANLIDQLSHDLQDRQTIMVHCAGGIGRAGTACACLLMAQGKEPSEAIDLVSHARGHAVPETKAQIEFVRSFKPARNP